MDNLIDYHNKVNERKFKYTDKSVLSSKILINKPHNVCIALYSKKLIKILKESRDKIEDIYVDATFDAVPSDLFPKKSRRKQFLTLMIKI